MARADEVFEFGPFCVDGVERQLLCEGRPVALTDKVFELLLLFVRNRGRALDKSELMSAIWPDSIVEENNLTVNVSALRKALGDNGSERRYIQTLARRGYRFVADVRVLAPNAMARDAPPPRRSRVFGPHRKPSWGENASWNASIWRSTGPPRGAAA
jgi:DNA-binding winged helix-turn-helix (wHTH) protein